MRPALAWLLLVALAALTAGAFVAPWPVLLAASAVGAIVMPRRAAFLAFVAVSLPLNAGILWYATGDPTAGLVGGLRLAAALAVNLAAIGRVGAARLLDGLRLPARATAILAAIVFAAHDVGRDFARMRQARRLDGDWPRSRHRRARDAARLLPPLLVASLRRAQTRRDALQLAGHPTAPWFVPFVAIAALCAAGRMAFLAVPNVALSYVVAFLGGLLLGPWVAAAGALAGMALTDFLLTGLYPGGFVNAPAMALLALLGGAMRAYRFEREPAAGTLMAGAIGVFATLVFSVAADSLTWLLLYASEPAAWAPIVLAGLAFNVLPALVNGALFAASVTPAARAFRAWQEARARPPRAPAPPASDAAPR